MKKIILSLIFISSLLAMSGNTLYEYGLEYVKAKNGLKSVPLKEGMFAGYIAGVNESIGFLGAYCMPKNTDGIAIMDIVFRYVENHPEKRNQVASFLVIDALKEVYPCKKNNN